MSVPRELLGNLDHAKHQILLTASDLMDREELEVLRRVLDQTGPEELIRLLGEWYGSLYVRTPVPVREWVESPQYMDLKGQLFPKLMDDFEELFSGEYDEAILHGSIGWGKCVPGYTEVLVRREGDVWERVPISSLMSIPSNTPVQTVGLDDETLRLKPVTVSAVKSDGVKPVYRMTLASGKTLDATAEHPIRTANGYTRLEDIEPGDLVATARHITLPGDPVDLPERHHALAYSDVYWDRVVSVEYLGEMEVFDMEVPETHNFLANDVVVHNSFFTGLSFARMVYEVSCLRNPQLTYGLAEGSQIVFLNVATNFTTAKEVVFQYVKNFIDRSPYFQKVFPLDKHLEKELRFPHNVRIAPVASTQGGILGQNMFGGCIDEANFLYKSARSVRAKSTNDIYDHAEVLYNAMIRRMRSRFMQHGKLPGILLIVSSSLYPDDFTERRIQQAIANNEKRVFHRRYSQWEPKPRHYYSGERFLLSLGNATLRPRIIHQPNEEGYDPELDDVKALEDQGIKVIEVPIEHKIEFQRDIDMAIRDVAGYPTLATTPFFRDRASIERAVQRGIEKGLKHPFGNLSVTMLEDEMWIQEHLDFTKAELPHFAHVDLALSGDAGGLSVVRLDGIEERKDVSIDPATGQEVETIEYVPRLTAVLMLRIQAPDGGEIDIKKVRGILLKLIDWGFYLHTVSYDQYQSAESIQQLQQLNVNAVKLSVDRGFDPYNSLKEAFYEDRIDIYPHHYLQHELISLERDVEKKKIDHPPKGSKDVADSLAGAVWHATVFVRDNPTLADVGELNNAQRPELPADIIVHDDGGDEQSLEAWLWSDRRKGVNGSGAPVKYPDPNEVHPVPLDL